jgi:hypothetical protein
LEHPRARQANYLIFGVSLANQYIPTSTPNEAVHFARRQYTAVMIAGAHLLLYSKGVFDCPSGGEIGLYQPAHPMMIEARRT